MHRVMAIALAALLAPACQGNLKKKPGGKHTSDANPGACLGIVRGAVTRNHPSVAMLVLRDNNSYEACTGTFIAPNAMITAAHCVRDTADGSVAYVKGDAFTFENTTQGVESLYRSGVRPSRVVHDGAAFMKGRAQIAIKDSYRDVAILIFARNVAPAVSPLITRPPAEGDKAVIVGFGQTALGQDRAETGTRVTKRKRVGENVVHIVTDASQAAIGQSAPIPGPSGPNTSGRLTIVGKANPAASETSGPALIAHGDSGGPLFIDGALAGVASNGALLPKGSALDQAHAWDPEADAMASHADVTHAFTQALLAKARDGGAKVGEAASEVVDATCAGGQGGGGPRSE